MKIYSGIRRPDGVKVTVDGHLLNPRYDLRNHSPDGFEWGYNGSGPAQLAIAILADALIDIESGEDIACEFYQRFKERKISPLNCSEWTMTELEITECVSSLMDEMLNQKGDGDGSKEICSNERRVRRLHKRNER